MSVHVCRLPFSAILQGAIARILEDHPTAVVKTFPEKNQPRPFVEISTSEDQDESLKDVEYHLVFLDVNVYGEHETAQDANDLAGNCLHALTRKLPTMTENWVAEDVEREGRPRARKIFDPTQGIQFWQVSFRVRWLVRDLLNS